MARPKTLVGLFTTSQCWLSGSENSLDAKTRSGEDCSFDDPKAFAFGLDAAICHCYNGRTQELIQVGKAIRRTVGGCSEFHEHPDASFFALRILFRALGV